MYELYSDPNPGVVLIRAIGDLDLVLSADLAAALRESLEPFAIVDLSALRSCAADGRAALDQAMVEQRTRGRSIDVYEPRRRRNAKRERSALTPSRIIILAHNAR